MRPQVTLAGGRALYVGPGLQLSPHRNAAATVVIALQQSFSLSLGDGAAPTQRRIAQIPPGTWHHLQAAGPMAFLYLDPLGDPIPDLPQRVALPADLHAPGVIDELLRAVGLQAPATPARLAATVRAMDADPRCFARIDDAARHAGLSISRFGHLFREETGLPFRRYRLWRRMATVARVVSTGRSLTDAAFEAGFASSAHLSASFRQLFGLAPSTLLRLHTRFVIH